MKTYRYAYTTLTDSRYVHLCAVMLKSLLASETAYPIRVMCLEDVSQKQKHMLRSLGKNIETHDITRIELPANTDIPHEAWRISFSRLHMLNFEKFDKLVFLDSDMIINTNIDDLFSHPVLSACSHHYPLRDDRVSINGGLVVLSPDTGLFRRIMEEYIHLPSPLHPHTWSLSDQEILIALFSTEDFAQSWRKRHGVHIDAHWHMLDYRYNAITGLNRMQTDSWDEMKAKVFHYTCGPKPWRTKKRQTLADSTWWKFYDQLIADTAYRETIPDFKL